MAVTDIDPELLKKAALKKAAGYTATESVDEYGCVEGDFVLLKRKVTTKEIAPETAAIKFLLESSEKKRQPTLSELETERKRLTELWAQEYQRENSRKET